MVRRGPLVIAALGLALTGLVSTGTLGAQERTAAAAGIPVASDLVVRSCSRCHVQDDTGRMSRISYLRKTPEGWSQTVRRMVSLNDVRLDPEAAREIVRYLADNHGIAPDELRPAFYEVERRHLTERPEMPETVRATCTACHTIGRIATQRRAPEEWKLLAETHRGLFPLVDRQVFRRGSVPDDSEFEFPVDEALSYLARSYPLETIAWADWSRNMRPARIAGTWAVRGYEVGRGPLYGTVTVTEEGRAGGGFTTEARYTYPAEGGAVLRSGEATVYTGYQWRGRSQASGDEHGELREVLFVERDWNVMFGRWFTGAYEELGVDVRMVRVGAAPVVLGAYPERLRTGQDAELRVYGANLPSGLGASDIDLGAGVEVLGVEQVAGDGFSLRVRVAPGAPEGARDIVVPGARGDGALVVYGAVDYIRVEPHPALARTGGASYEPGLARFEAIGYSDGPDRRRGTDDDVRIGAVEATWSLVEYPRTYDDDDVEFVGRIDERGRFTPGVDGPNPERSGLRNNIGEVWVVAEHLPDGATASAEPLRARSVLVVAPPNYIEWEPRDDAMTTLQQGGGR